MSALQVGDKVKHPKMLDWGVGKILNVLSGGKVKVYFINSGEKIIDQKYVQLEKLEGEGDDHPILDNPTFHERAGSKGHKGLPDARLDFLNTFPLGFADPMYLKEERDYKVDAHNLLNELLGSDTYADLLKDQDYAEICKRALQVVNKTNLIFPNEKMALKDGLKDEENSKLFADRLFDLLYAGGDFKVRYEAFADCLERIDADKWTILTYFPYIAFPQDHIFLKPEVTKHATSLMRAELNYKPSLNWLTYSCLLNFATYLKDQLEAMDMAPRDMIDVQSFMWCIAPGKYDQFDQNLNRFK